MLARARAHAFSLVAMFAALLAFAAPGSAQEYPSQAVRLVVPFSAGSMTDILARAVADRLSAKWKQQVIVENRPGIAGTSSVAKAMPDGYTLLLTSNGHTIVSALNRNLNFDPQKDFVGITQVAITPSILVASPEGSIKTLSELLAAAKARPGALNYGSAGLGSTTNIAFETLLQTAQIKMTHVPYRGLPESQTAILRGDVAAGFTFFNVGGDLIQAGKLRALAVSGAERLKQLPDLPTFAEAGLPGYRYDAWFGLLAPSETPKPIVAKVSADVGEILREPEMRSRFVEQGVQLVSQTPERFDAILREDTARFGKLFEQAAR